MKPIETNHSKLLKDLSESTEEKWTAHHKELKEGRFNVLELRLQDNDKKHDTEYFKEKFIKNGFIEIKNKSILEEQSQNKKITPFTGEGKGTKVEISSDSFGRTNIRVVINKNELEKNEVEKLEKAFNKELIGRKKIKIEVKHKGWIESIKGLLKRAA
ncbi:MAG: hypothetical protein M1594_00175 [Candidatus Marsarchaeota archaeon]|nr:hypothetical protein [Candidatus Marsarchaeota archaeon]